MWFNILGFWAVGFTTGYTLTFRFHWGLPGVWWGILSGVMVTGQYALNPAVMLSQYELDHSFCFTCLDFLSVNNDAKRSGGG